MGNAHSDHKVRQRLRQQLRTQGLPDADIDRVVSALAERQRTERHRGTSLVRGALTQRERYWRDDAARRHTLADTTLDLLIHEHRRSVGAGRGPILWSADA